MYGLLKWVPYWKTGGRRTAKDERRIGLEQEFFLVDGDGLLSNRADEFLSRAQEAATDEGLSPENFVGECTRGMVEVNTSPAATLADLEREYFAVLDLALRAGREVGIRLYPLAAYPLPMTPAFRDEPNYELQAIAVGRERFVHAGRCIGTHLHLETAEGTVDAKTVVSRAATPEAIEELVNLYNLAVALDPAIVALTRSSPFYEGAMPGVAVRTARYRGSAVYGWEGVYTHLPLVGGLKPYAASAEDLVFQQLVSYQSWVSTLVHAGLGEDLYLEAGGALLKAHWGPVRVGGFGTVEMRGIDGNFPAVILAIVAVVAAAARRARQESLSVKPSEEVRTLEVSGEALLVPAFPILNGELLYAAVTNGPKDPSLIPYLDSLLAFAEPYLEDPQALETLRPHGVYGTTESRIREAYAPDASLETEEGLSLVLAACDELERQVGEGIRVEASGFGGRT
jgi:carboxylate-amine ligase